MNLYIYLTPFVLCFNILICNARIFDWLVDGFGNPPTKYVYTTTSQEVKQFSTTDLMKIRNATALEYWRRDYDHYDEKKYKTNRKIHKKEGITRHIARTREINIRNRSYGMNQQRLRSRWYSQEYSNETRTSPIMRADHRMHKEKREVNWNPNLRQATSDYRSTRITPMSAEKLQAEKDEVAGMNHMMSPYNLAEEVRKIIIDEFPNINMTMEVIARTVEYKDIVLIRTTESKEAIQKRIQFRATNDDKFIDEQPEKKIIFIVHGLSVMGIQYMACFRRKSHFRKLLSFYFQHLDKFDIYLIPMANPDGFAHAMNNPMSAWNKNISPQVACRGVALDRNFDVAWNTTKLVSSCSQQYPGTSPFSEAETRAIRDIFHRYGHKIIAYINVHSGTFDQTTFKGDAVLYPKGYTDVTTDDDKYIDLRGEIDEAMKNASFEAVSVYVDTLHSWYGKVCGTSVDYASTVYGVPYALEFVMQLYSEKDPNSREKEDPVGDAALEEIWGKVIINTVFNNIWKSLQHVNDA